jgi:peptidoglycan/LPS O-acetylase OafA/YrhL
MLIFSVFAYFWLMKELQSQSLHWNWLERCGAASYSLYLVHNVVFGGLEEHFSPAISISGMVIRWSAVTVATCAFYWIVEAPSHRLARNAPRVGLRIALSISKQWQGFHVLG